MTKQKNPSITLKSTFLSLAFPNYWLWFVGQVISLLGTWMQTTAQGYLVYQLTGSKVLLGMVALAAAIPNWVLMLFAGVLAERISRRMLILLAQVWLMIMAFVLSLLAFLGVVAPLHIILLAVGTGIGQAIAAPARHAFVSDLVDRSAIANAIGMNSTMFNLGTFLGPAVGGLVYVSMGPEWCFAVNGISFIAVIIALAVMKLPPKTVEAVTKKKHWTHDLIYGIHYVLTYRRIRVLIILTGIFSFFGFSVITMFPAWSVAILKGDATTFGFL